MQNPPNFSAFPEKDPHKYLKNICIEFRKKIIAKTDMDQLQEEMEKVINAAKQISWKHEHKGVWKKEDAEKMFAKVWSEFDRYFLAMKKQPASANPQDLLDALAQVEQLVA